MRKFLLLLLVIPGALSAQNYRTDQAGGAWSNNTSWEVFSGGSWLKLESTAFPTPNTASGTILIQHNIFVSASVSADQVTIASGVTLTISASQTLTIADGTGSDLINNGTITTTGALSFAANSTYQHARDGGTIPLATWGANSTCWVTGITATNPTLIPSNAYQNFVWECTQTGTRSLAGNLRTVNGNLLINETGNQELRFSIGTAYNLTIGGDFTVGGTSAIAFGTNASPVNITLTGDFDFASTATLDSQLKTTGQYSFTIAGGFSQSSGTINMSTGNNTGTINVAGDFSQTGGTITRTGGNGSIVLNGTLGAQNLTVNGTLSSIVDLTITNTAGVSLAGNLVLPSNLTQNSGAGIFDLNGFSLTIDGSLVQTSGSIGVNTTAQLILQGSGTLSGSLSLSGTDLLKLELNQTGTITSSSSVTVTNLNLLNGTLTSNTISMAVGGLITRSAGVLTNTPGGTSYNVLYTNTTNINTGSELPASTTVLNDLTKQGNGTTTLNQALTTINGNLTLSAGTFACGANSISLVGNFISNGTFSAANGSTFTFTGAVATLTGSVSPTFNALSVTGTFTPSVGYRLNGNYTVGVGATVNPGGVTVTFGGTTTITNSGVMNLNAVVINNASSMTAPSTTLGISGNFTSTGTFNHGNGTILFNGTTDLSAPENYNNITVTGVVTSGGSFNTSVAGDVINNGSFQISSVASRGNLTWSGSGTFSGTGNATVGDLNVTGASFTYTSSGNLTILDDILGNGNVNSSASSGTLILAGAGARFAGTGTKTFGNLSVTGTLTPAVSYSVSGDMDIAGTLVSGATVTFNGTTQSVTGTGSAIAFNNVTINNSSILTITPSVTVNGNLTVNGSITTSGTVTFAGLTISGAGPKNFNHVTVGTGTLIPNGNYSIAGDLVINGTLSAGTGNATFNGTTVASGAGAATFNSVSITGSFTARTSAEPSLIINGNLTNSGSFQGSSGTVSLAGNLINNGTFSGGTGTFIFNTTNSASSRTITGSNSVSFYNLTIFDKGIATDVSNDLGAGLTADVAGSLSFGEANAVINSNGAGGSSLRFVSTSDNPSNDGRVAALTFANSRINGNIIVQRFVSSENRIYRYISAPVVGATVAQLKAAIPITGKFLDPSTALSTPPCVACNTDNPSLFFWNTATNLYKDFPTTNQTTAGTTFTNGRGYSAFFRHTGTGAVGTVVINFTGTHPVSTGVSMPVNPSANGFSLVGNPYPSPIVWNNSAGWTKSNIADVIVVRDNATGIHQSHGTADNFIIAPGQAFWVQSSAAGASLSINEAAKTTGTYSFYRDAEVIIDGAEINLTKESTNITDYSHIAITPNSQLIYDSFDGIKFDNSIDDGTVVTQVHDVSILSTDASAKKLAISAVPSACNQSFKVNIDDVLNAGETSANYVFNFMPKGSLAALPWKLHDSKTNSDIDLSVNPNYSFTVDISEATVVTTGTNPVITRYHLPNRFTLVSMAPQAVDVTRSIIANNTFCSGSDAVLKLASQNGFTYSLEVNGVLYSNLALGDGTEISLFANAEWLNAPTNTIKVKVNSGCEQQYLNQVIELNSQSTPSVTSVSSANLCQPGSANLQATSGSGNVEFRWFESQNSSQPIATGAIFVTPILSDSTSYFVSAVNSAGCESERVMTSVDVNDLSETISFDEINPVCKSESITLSASSTLAGGTFEWYNPNGSSPIATGDQLLIPSLTESKTLEVVYKDVNGCASSRIQLVASVIDYSPNLQVVKAKELVCAGERHILTVQGAEPNATYQWFDSSNSNSPIFEGVTFITEPLNSSTEYFVRANGITGCSSQKISTVASVDVNNLSLPIEFAQSKICREGEAQLSITSTSPVGVNYNWYTSSTERSPVFKGKQFTTAALATTTSYFVTVVNANGCESSVRKEVVVGVTSYPEPKIDFTSASELKSNFSTGNQWYLNNESMVGETASNLIVKESGDYDLKVTYQGCEERAGAVNITTIVTGLEDPMQEVSIFPNPASEIVRVRVVGATQQVSCTFIDQNGRSLVEMPLTQVGEMFEGQLNVKPFSSGLYFLKITSGGKSVAHRVILK